MRRSQSVDDRNFGAVLAGILIGWDPGSRLLFPQFEQSRTKFGMGLTKLHFLLENGHLRGIAIIKMAYLLQILHMTQKLKN